MTIFTSSWFTKLPDTVQKIGVSRGTPRGYPAGYRKMMSLAPGSYFKTASVSEYRRLYFEGLARLDPHATIGQIQELAGGRDCALLCYEAPEKSEDWCHRGYVSVWLQDKLGLDVFEFGMEDAGCGWSHPKIPEQYRGKPQEPERLDVSPYIGSRAFDRQGCEWEVIGPDPDNPDQALARSVETGLTGSVSGDVLHAKFKPV